MPNFAIFNGFDITSALFGKEKKSDFPKLVKCQRNRNAYENLETIYDLPSVKNILRRWDIDLMYWIIMYSQTIF